MEINQGSWAPTTTITTYPNNFTPPVYYYWYPQYVPAHSPHQCPSTHKHKPKSTLSVTGVQCKYSRGHDGDHAAYGDYSTGDVFWGDEAVKPEAEGAQEELSSCA